MDRQKYKTERLIDKQKNSLELDNQTDRNNKHRNYEKQIKGRHITDRFMLIIKIENGTVIDIQKNKQKLDNRSMLIIE